MLGDKVALALSSRALHLTYLSELEGTTHSTEVDTQRQLEAFPASILENADLEADDHCNYDCISLFRDTGTT